MIPKIIHYCWFGRKEKPKKIKKCIESWKKIMPDYQIIEWNEDNFDINLLKYTKDAYNAEKYAFVSDVARVKALYEMGGIYLDTDVVVYKSFDSILNNRCVLGFEMGNYIATSFMACEKNFFLMRNFYCSYASQSFYKNEKEIEFTTNVSKLTNMLIPMGLNRNNKFQLLENDIVIFPQEYFSPYDYGNCVKNNTENTICEHLYLVSWLSEKEKVKKIIKRILFNICGQKAIGIFRKIKRG